MHNLVYKGWRIFATGFSFAVFGLGAAFIACALSLLIWPLPLKQAKKQHCTRTTLKSALWLYIRMMYVLGLLTFELKQKSELRGDGQLIIANHPSLLDVVFLIAMTPDTNCIVKAALWKNPLTRGVVTLAGYIPNDDDSDALIAKAANVLMGGQTLIIFPEGTRTKDFDNLKFKRGAANIALRAQCEIRPVHIDCSPPTLRKNRPWYDVPDATPHFTIEVLPPLFARDCIDDSRPQSIQARQLNQAMKDHILKPRKAETRRSATLTS